MFDYATIVDGKIVERIQQSETLSQMIQMYSRAAKRAGVLAGGALTSSLIALIGKRLLSRRTRA